MIEIVKRQVSKLLREIADKIECNTSDITEDEAIAIMRAVAHERMTKEEVSVYLNMSRSRFDDYVRFGRFPRGRKLRGDKALFWYKDEIDDCVRQIRLERKGRSKNKSKISKYVEEI